MSGFTSTGHASANAGRVDPHIRGRERANDDGSGSGSEHNEPQYTHQALGESDSSGALPRRVAQLPATPADFFGALLNAPPTKDVHHSLTSQALNADGTPKRPMNAFMIFARRRRPQVSAANQMMRTGEISKILSKEWTSMPMVSAARCPIPRPAH